MSLERGVFRGDKKMGALRSHVLNQNFDESGSENLIQRFEVLLCFD